MIGIVLLIWGAAASYGVGCVVLVAMACTFMQGIAEEARKELAEAEQQAQLDSDRLHLAFNEERRRRGFLVLCGCELCASRRFALRAARTCGDGDCDEAGGCYRNKCGARGW